LEKPVPRTLAEASLFVVLLAGCGQLHSLTDPPVDTGDTGAVVDDTADTAASDTDTGDTAPDDTDTGSDTGDTGLDTGDTGAGPELLSFEVTDGGSGVADVAFSATDPDGDLAFLRLTVGSLDHDLDIPADIDSWDPSGISHVYWETSNPASCNPTSESFSGRVFDQAGRPSDALADSVTLAGGGAHSAQEAEPNQWKSEATWLGALSRPVTLTGAADVDNDHDYVMFTACDGGTWNFTLTWSDQADDLDLHLYDASGTRIAYAFTFDYPETISFDLTAEATYYLRVFAWDPGSTWTVEAP
jgi:hypothetical protein